MLYTLYRYSSKVARYVICFFFFFKILNENNMEIKQILNSQIGKIFYEDFYILIVSCGGTILEPRTAWPACYTIY